MVQFKNVFYRFRKRDYKTATTSQNVFWGKHNDLENVYIHQDTTLFEMLGNFSFGDYFKRGNFSCLEFINKIFNCPKKNSVTVYHEDEESFKLWKIAGLVMTK